MGGPPLAVSLAAQMGTLPLVAAYFGRLAPVSVAANLVVVPLMGASVGLGMLTVLADQISSTVATWLNGANWLALQGAIHGARWFGSLPWASVEVARPSPAFLATYLCALPLCHPDIRACRLGKATTLAVLSAANTWA